VLPAAFHPHLTGEPAPDAPDLWASLTRPIAELQESCFWALSIGAEIDRREGDAAPVAVGGGTGEEVIVAGEVDPATGAVAGELHLTIERGYADPLLVRGPANLDLHFDDGSGPAESVFLPAEAAPFPVAASAEDASDRTWVVRIQASKADCYILKVDGWDFRQMIVVRLISPQ
jgi:hypothetical protein